MKQLVVSDSSTLIALQNINKAELLKNLFSAVIVPPIVADEVEQKLTSDSSWFVLKQQKFIKVQTLKNDSRLPLLKLQLDPGESEAILLADQLNLLLLIDEKAGRKMAQNMGLKIQGLVGVLYALKQQNFISNEETEIIVDALEQVKFRMHSSLKSLLLD